MIIDYWIVELNLIIDFQQTHIELISISLTNLLLYQPNDEGARVNTKKTKLEAKSCFRYDGSQTLVGEYVRKMVREEVGHKDATVSTNNSAD